ncbi:MULTISPECIES: hypothetical protein [unclassified Streptomyces]|nr:hypothetical protein OG832_13480 [Streptomyces sp. NBC_00826]
MPRPAAADRARHGTPQARRRNRPMYAATMPAYDGVCTDPV